MDEKPALKGNMLLDYSGAKKLWAWSQLKHSCSTSVTENATHGSTSDLEQEKTCLSRGRLPKLKQCISIVRCTEQVKTEQLHSLLEREPWLKVMPCFRCCLLLLFFLSSPQTCQCRCPPCPSVLPLLFTMPCSPSVRSLSSQVGCCAETSASLTLFFLGTRATPILCDSTPPPAAQTCSCGLIISILL